MKLTCLETFEEVVNTLDDRIETSIIILNNDQNLELEMDQMTPKKWSFYQSCRVINVQTTKLEVLLALLTKQLLYYKGDSEGVDRRLILNGLITTISILYSHFLDRKQINYNQLNFQRVFLIFTKLQQLEQHISVTLIDTKECINVLPNIYIPVRDTLTWTDFLQHLNSDDKDMDNFQCLSDILDNFIPKSELPASTKFVEKE